MSPMRISVACPYCNARFPNWKGADRHLPKCPKAPRPKSVIAAMPKDEAIHCIRCGEDRPPGLLIRKGHLCPEPTPTAQWTVQGVLAYVQRRLAQEMDDSSPEAAGIRLAFHEIAPLLQHLADTDGNNRGD